ncbi:MAG: hypothetical protein AAF747_06340 [Planctomycetota bacterium]
MLKTAATAVALFAGLASAQSLGTVDMKFTGTADGRNVRVTANGETMRVFAGQLKYNVSSGTGFGASLVGNQLTFCTDLFERVNRSTRPHDLVAGVPTAAMTSDAVAMVSNLVAVAGQQAFTTTDDDFAAAFQLAVWEVVTEMDGVGGELDRDAVEFSLDGGDFVARASNGSPLSSDITSQAQLFLNQAAVLEGSLPVIIATNDGSQDQMFLQTVPAPAALATLGFGLLLKPRRRK